MVYNQGYRCDWGEIFGIAIGSLTEEQLGCLCFEKLVECISLDDRVPGILASRLDNALISPNQLSYLLHIKDILPRFENIFNKYNEYIAKSDVEIDKLYYYRNNIVEWSLLNDENRKKEIERWVSGRTAVVSASTIDYEWLYGFNKDLYDSMVLKIFKERFAYNGKPALINLIRTAPADKIDDLALLMGDGTDYFVNLASNRHTPEKYMDKILRIIAKKTYPPTIAAKITYESLEKLPTITRLNVMEKIVNSDALINNINEDQARRLLFPSVVRYPGRVEEVVKRLKTLRDRKEHE